MVDDLGDATEVQLEKKFYLSALDQLSDLTKEEMEFLVYREGELKRLVRDFLSCLSDTGYNFNLFVNGEKEVKGALNRGFYDKVDSRLYYTDFLAYRKGVENVQSKLLKANRVTSLKEVFFRINKMGYEPAGIREFLVFCEKYPDFKSGAPVFSPDFWLQVPEGGGKLVPYVVNIDGRREIGLWWTLHKWPAGSCFLVTLR